MKTLVNGDVFVVPNSLVMVKNLFHPEETIERMKAFGLEVNEDDLLVELWSTGSESDNWADHGWTREFLSQEERMEYYKNGDLLKLKIKNFPSFLPIKLFEGKREGDQVILKTKPEGNSPSITVRLTLNQMGYRYRHYGPFEAVLDSLIQVYKRKH